MKSWKRKLYRKWAHACVDHARGVVGENPTKDQVDRLRWAEGEALNTRHNGEPNWSAGTAAKWCLAAVGEGTEEAEEDWQQGEWSRLHAELRLRYLQGHPARAQALKEVLEVLDSLEAYPYIVEVKGLVEDLRDKQS